jgi:hypothetical protein
MGMKTVLGWREFVGLPDLHVTKLKVKIDTGARTSALHAEDILFFRHRGRIRVRFKMFPVSRERTPEIVAEADLVGRRNVRSSTGLATERPVIRTVLSLGGKAWPIEVTLINREIMGYRMLLGREALRGRCVVDPQLSFALSKTKKTKKKATK